MTPRFDHSALLVRVAVILAALGWSAQCLAQSKPNIIVMMTDDNGYADWGFMDQLTGQNTEFKTPRLDALAQQSVLFSNAYVSSPACSPSRAGMLTGRYQQRFGTDYNITNANNPLDGTPTHTVLISEALKAHGYTTGAIGKWHQGTEPAKQPLNQGFDEFYGFFEGGRAYFQTIVSQQIRRGSTPIQWQNEPSFNNIPPDPVYGREVTDAFGDEASAFIANHANDANPFFLYVAFNAAHSPYDKAKAQDLAQFDDTSLTGYRKNVAALTYSVDRAVGNVLDRLDDPNGDGNTSDSIADNTIIVFLNDNGGNTPTDGAANGQMVHSNGPLREYKGTAYEGGFRVPMIIRAPGVDPGIFNETVTALDLFPTFLKAAGGAPGPEIDGVDLMPYLTGAETGQVHDKIFTRLGETGWAIRKGDWKLTRAIPGATVRLYKLNPDGSGETVFQEKAHPDIYLELARDYVDWEASLAKPVNSLLRSVNRFDAFQFRTDIAPNANWRDGHVWRNNDSPSTTVSMGREDPYANAVLVFHPRNDSDYTSNNDISRMAGLSYATIASGQVNPANFNEFMLNELRFEGQFSGAVNRSGTLTGAPLMFVKNLSGQGPKMVLESASAVANKFTFNVNMDVVLHSSMEITGNSTQNFAVAGQIRDFDEPMNVTKTGSSAITLAGNNIYKGATVINSGILRIAGPNAALAETSQIQIGAQGTLSLASGRIHTPSIHIASGGIFNFTGGNLETNQVNGDLINTGGQLRPGLSVGTLVVTEDLVQSGGSLAIEIGGPAAGQYDSVLAHQALIGGNLQVSLVNLGSGMYSPAVGAAFEIVKSVSGIHGEFASINAPSLPAGRDWAIAYNGQSVVLQVVAGLQADFDDNGAVDSSDLAIWKSGVGGDADGDGDADGADFMVWQRQFGLQLVQSSAAAATVPEPSSMAIAAAIAAAAYGARRRP